MFRRVLFNVTATLPITLIFLLAGAPLGHAQTPAPWTAAGSTGMVDEADAAAVQFGQTGQGISILHEAAFVRPSAPPTEVDLRYNVVAVDGLLTGDRHWVLRARVRDTGPAVVFARLMRVNLITGQSTELLTLQSNLFPPAEGFRRLSTGRPPCSDPGFVFNFMQNIYFVEVTLAKNGSNGQPAVAGLQIAPTTCR